MWIAGEQGVEAEAEAEAKTEAEAKAKAKAKTKRKLDPANYLLAFIFVFHFTPQLCTHNSDKKTEEQGSVDWHSRAGSFYRGAKRAESDQHHLVLLCFSALSLVR